MPTSCSATNRFPRWTNPPPASCAANSCELVKENGKTAVFITHSISEALEIGDRIVVLKRPAMIAYDVSFDKDTSLEERMMIRERIGEVLAA